MKYVIYFEIFNIFKLRRIKMKSFPFLASVIFSLGIFLACSTMHAGELGVDFSQEQWYDKWAAEFDATSVPAAADKDAETSDVIVQPSGGEFGDWVSREILAGSGGFLF